MSHTEQGGCWLFFPFFLFFEDWSKISLILSGKGLQMPRLNEEATVLLLSSLHSLARDHRGRPTGIPLPSPWVSVIWGMSALLQSAWKFSL